MFKKAIALLIVFSMTIGSVFATAYDQEGIKKEIYDNASQYKTEFDVEYIGDTSNLSKILDVVIDDALSVEDYLLYLLNSYEVSYSYTPDEATIHMSLNYLSTANQEAYVRKEVEKILLALQLDGLSDYQRIEKIANYMDGHYSYDETLAKRDAYTMMISSEGVCQAYAQLFYLLAKGADVPVRNQSGKLEGTPHLWNLVKINETWYHIDITNFKIFKGTTTILQGSSTLSSKGFTWDKLLEPAVDTVFAVDTSYDSKGYNPAEISAKIMPKSLDYQMSETAKAAEERITNFKIYKDILNKYFEQQPENKTPVLYQDAVLTFSKLKAINVEPDTVLYFENAFLELKAKNDKKVLNYISGNITKANAMVAKTANETNLKKALKFLEDTKAYVPKMIFDTKNQAYYNKVLDARIKHHAQQLVNYYVTQYKKTKKATFKTAYTTLAKKYSITVK